MPTLSPDDIKRAKMLVEAHAELVQSYKERALAEDDGVLSVDGKGFLNIRGHEVVSDEQVEPPLGYLDQPDLMETIRRMIRSEELHRAHQEAETFEEADDFDVDDDFDPSSPYEWFFDPEPGAAAGPSDMRTAAPSGLGDPPPATAQPAGEPQRGGGGAEPPGDKQTSGA